MRGPRYAIRHSFGWWTGAGFDAFDERDFSFVAHLRKETAQEIVAEWKRLSRLEGYPPQHYRIVRVDTKPHGGER